MASLDWSKCPAVESVPGRLSGAWVFKDTRMPVSAVFDNLEAGATIDEIIEQFDITREQINAVLEFAARSLDTPAQSHAKNERKDGAPTIRKYTDFEEMKADEYRYWQSRPPHERLDAVDEMIQAAYAIKGWEIEPDVPRLQRPFVRLPCPWS